MSIAVIDISPSLYWFVSSALATLEIPMKHYPDSNQANKIIVTELPDIVILNSDDSNINIAELIGKMRNHIFARNILFVVFTSKPEMDHRRQLIIQGAGLVFFRNGSINPDPKYFLKNLTWLLELKKNKPHKFDHPNLPFFSDGEFTSWGRMGWISEVQCLIESNVDLMPGESIPIDSPLFEDLGIKNPVFTCREKNKTGRYYQYANSFLGEWTSKHTEQDLKKLKAWIKDNETTSKNKPVKLVFFESDANYRDDIAKMIKLDSRYCARGYKDIEDFENTLKFQIPNLVLINRALIQKNKSQFDALKKFIKTNLCFCITYAHNEDFDINEFKKNYEFAMHLQGHITAPVLESMIAKLDQKMTKDVQEVPKVIFNKYSALSRMSFHLPIKITEISNDGIQIRIPVLLNNYCSMEIASIGFTQASIGRVQIFRSLEAKKGQKTIDGYFHKLLFIGQSIKEQEATNSFIESIKNEKNEPNLKPS